MRHKAELKQYEFYNKFAKSITELLIFSCWRRSLLRLPLFFGKFIYSFFSHLRHTQFVELLNAAHAAGFFF